MDGGGVVPTLNAFENNSDSRATVIVFDMSHRQDGIRLQGDTVNTLQARMGTGGNNVPAIAYEPTQDPAGTITTNGWRCDVNKAQNGHLAVGPTVRRLTPTECERLQGFPDGWTTHRVDEKKGLIEQADGARYKQMGNAVAVPVVEWIMARLVEVDSDNA